MVTKQASKRIISVIVLAIMALVGPTSAALAHVELISTSPTVNSDIGAAQESISLTFSEPPLVDGAAIVVMNQAGDILDSPAPALKGASLSIPWPPDLTPGKVLITWRATASDGHVQSGEFFFNYTAAAESAPAPSASAAPDGGASSVPTGADTAVPTGADTAAPEPMMTTLETPVTNAVPTEVTQTFGSNNLALIVAISALAGLVAVGLYLRRSK